MDNLLSLMDKLHICIARSFHRGVVSCTLHKTVISAAERLMVSNEILLQCVTMGTSVSLRSLHTLPHSPGVNLYATKAKVEIFKWTYKDAFIVYSECPKWLSDRKSQVM